jgi:hypothetical protein
MALHYVKTGRTLIHPDGIFHALRERFSPPGSTAP